MNRIAGVLLEVNDWTGLASELGVERGEQNVIRDNCKVGTGVDVATCYRRSLVESYFDRTGLEVEEVAENIAVALESIYHKRQAKQLREMYPPKSGKSYGNY